MTVDVSWQSWFNSSLDALEQAVLDANVSWGTHPDGEEWVVIGDHTPRGIEYPACFIPEFSSSRVDGESDTETEMRGISATVWIVDQADVKEQEANLRDAIDMGAKVMQSIYENRTLQQTCHRVDVTDVTPGSAVVNGEAVITTTLELSIIKSADIHTVRNITGSDFDVSITGTNSPVDEGGTLDVDVSVDNNGGDSGTQDIVLSIGGDQKDSQEVTLSSGSSTTLTLSWSTGAGDAGDYIAKVESDLDEALEAVTVLEPGTTPGFQVDVEGSNSPVNTGSMLMVDAIIYNTGDDATKTVDLLVDGTVRSSKSIQLNSDNGSLETFTWDVPDGFTEGSYTATIDSGDDSDNISIQVNQVLAGSLSQWEYKEGSGDTVVDVLRDADGARNGWTWVSGDYVGGYAGESSGGDYTSIAGDKLAKDVSFSESWSGASNNPQIEGYGEPDFIKESGTYYLYLMQLNPLDSIELYTSSSKDGPWTSQGEVVTPSSSGWDSNFVGDPSIIEVNGTYYLYYSGDDGSGYAGIGVATASDPTGPFSKESGNPILTSSSSGWDSARVTEPHVRVKDSTYYMTYSGGDGSTEALGLATSSDGIAWSKEPGNPIYDIGDINDQCHFYHDGAWHLYYTNKNTLNIEKTSSPDITNFTKGSGELIATSASDYSPAIRYVPNLDEWVMYYHPDSGSTDSEEVVDLYTSQDIQRIETELMDGGMAVVFTIDEYTGNTSSGTRDGLLGNNVGNAEGFLVSLSRDQSGGIELGATDGSETSFFVATDDSTPIDDGGKHRVVCQKKGNTEDDVEIYVDTTQYPANNVLSSGTLTSFSGIVQDLYHFAQNNAGSPGADVACRLDNMIVTDEVLDSTQIQQDYDDQPWT